VGLVCCAVTGIQGHEVFDVGSDKGTPSLGGVGEDLVI
jgi:hypothetical protein